jgi:multidrug efflux system outer membrane protein
MPYAALYLPVLGLFAWCFMTISVLILVPGCGLPKPEREPGQDLEMPDTWTSAKADNQGKVGFGWLAEFEDPDMEQLVAEAIDRNRDLRAAAARLRRVEEGMIVGRAGRLPWVSASGSGSYSETRFDDGTGDLEPWVNDKRSRLSTSASWEVDLWGRLANLHRASIEDYQAEAASYRGARLSLAATTAKAWCNLITAGQQVELARQTRDSFERNARIVERGHKEGDPTASALAVNFGRNQVAAAERSLISRQLARDETRRFLELLLGRYPATELKEPGGLPTLGRAIPAGLPSELLMRRPDLAEAAARLRATAERASAARKSLLPSIDLTAGGSSTGASLELQDLIKDPAQIAWNVATSLTAPIYRGGALRARARQALATNDVAVANFSAIALQAFREVESALATEHSLADQERFLETELQQANLAETNAYRDFSKGAVDILSVLEAQRRAFNARNAMISLRNGRIQNRIDLHLALGGDFETPPAEDEANGASSDKQSSRENKSAGSDILVAERH